MKHYDDRDVVFLDECGNYYCRHIMAMTVEGLHSKSDIAAELGYRDQIIDDLRKEIENWKCVIIDYDSRREL